MGCGDAVGNGFSISGSVPIGLLVSPVEIPPPPQAISVVLTSTVLSMCLIIVLSPKTQKNSVNFLTKPFQGWAQSSELTDYCRGPTSHFAAMRHEKH